MDSSSTTPPPGGPALLFSERFRANARRSPHQLALKMGERSLDYAQLAETAEKIAAALGELGAAPGDRVAIIARTSVEYCCAIVGILLARCVVVPLSTTLPAEALASLLADAAPFAVFADAEGQAELDAAGFAGLRVDLGGPASGSPDLASWLSAPATQRGGREQQASDLFSIIYSSGTTGVPKGIAHDCGARSAFFALGDSGPGGRTLLSTAIYTNASFCNLLGAFYTGGACVLLERFDAEAFISLVQRERITRCFLVPVQLRRILASPQFDRDALDSLQLTIMSGSPCPLPLKLELAERWPGDLIENYGLSEGGVLTQISISREPHKLASVGRLLPGFEMIILDEADQPAAPGAEGEIVGRSPFVMRGYYGREDLTEASSWRAPNGDLFQRTGDIGRLDEDGYLHIVDRKKDVIISGGINVSATEIDQLIETFEEVLEAAVVAAKSERWGETPIAIVVPQPGRQLDAAKLCAAVNARLPRHSRLSAVHLATELPRNAMGKVVKRELRERFGQ